MQITINITGDDKLRIGLKDFGDAIPNISLKRRIQAMQRAQKRASTWVGGNSYLTPPPFRTKYRRTGIYGGSFRVQADGGAVRLISRARAPRTGREYTTYVGGNAEGLDQARIHIGRWPVIRAEVEQETAQLVTEIDGDLSAVARREGFGL